LQDGTFATKKYTMRKLTKKIAAAMLFCSLTIATPLLAQNDTRTTQAADRDNDDSGKWGLLGLLGLFGLIGFKKRDDYDRTRTTTTRNP
jgi:hypothetical protein